MKDLKYLVCTPAQSGQLVKLGLMTNAFFFHYLVEDHQEKDVEKSKFKWLTKYTEGVHTIEHLEVLPAWTKAEIEAFIGPDKPKPDIMPEAMVGKAGDPYSYPVFFPEKMQSFKSGATAAAAGLIYLLEKKLVDPSEAKERYYKFFP